MRTISVMFLLFAPALAFGASTQEKNADRVQQIYTLKSHNLGIHFDAAIHKMEVVDSVVLSETWDSKSPFIAQVESLLVVTNVRTAGGKKLEYTYQGGRLEVRNLTNSRSFIIEYEGILNSDIHEDNYARVADSFYLLKFFDWIFTPNNMKAKEATMEYDFPKELDIVTEGEKVSETIIGDRKISKWQVGGCSSWLYFMVGKWHKKVIHSDKVEIRAWLVSDKPKLAHQLVKRIERVIKLYSEIYTPYPHRTFTYLEFPNDYSAWNGFGKLVFLRESAILDFEWVAHEIAHNWWPNYIVLRRDNQLDLDSEAFCDFSAALAHEFVLGSVNKQGRAHDMVWLMAYPEGQHWKGIPLLHNLRLIYGDKLFFRWLRQFSEKFKGREAFAGDLFAMAPHKEGFELNGFLASWGTIRVPPTFKLHFETMKKEAGGLYELTVRIDQESDPLVKWYVPIQVRSKHGVFEKMVALKDKTTTCHLALDSEPQEVTLDPNYYVSRRVPEFQKFADVLVLTDDKIFPLLREKKYQECLPLLLRALELDPENAETYYLLARVHKNLNQEEKAKQFYSEVIDKKLGWYMGNRYTTGQLHTYSHWELAQTYSKEGNYQQARKNLEGILQGLDIEDYHKKASEELKRLSGF